MNTEIKHHGILGQKWGVRRYQNPDGSLTAAGKKRYLEADGSLNKVGQKVFYDKHGNATSVGQKYLNHKAVLEEADRIVKSYDVNSKDPKHLEKILDLIAKEDGSGSATDYAANHLWNPMRKRIEKDSGNWYESEGVSDNFKKTVAEYNDRSNAIDKQYDKITAQYQPLLKEAFKRGQDSKCDRLYAEFNNKTKPLNEQKRQMRREYNDKIIDVVLDDLGIEKSKKNRANIRDLVLWD